MMRMTPELMERIDAARGDTDKTAWVERAILMRLGEAASPNGAERSPSSPDPVDDAEPLGDGDGVAGPPLADAEPERWPRRPQPRTTGGRRRQR